MPPRSETNAIRRPSGEKLGDEHDPTFAIRATIAPGSSAGPPRAMADRRVRGRQAESRCHPQHVHPPSVVNGGGRDPSRTARRPGEHNRPGRPGQAAGLPCVRASGRGHLEAVLLAMQRAVEGRRST